MSLTWLQAVKESLNRYALNNSTVQIERDSFLRQELPSIISVTASIGKTPAQTVSRVLQELRDEGFLYFSSSGLYTLNKIEINATNEDLPDDVLENAVTEGLLILPDVEATSEVSMIRVRRGMSALRKRTLANYRNSCALCDINDAGLLVSSHIARWADHPEARGLLSNTICLCTLHDKLFENGYFAMRESLELIWKSPQPIRAIDIWRQQCTVSFKLPQCVKPKLVFINEHRNRVGL
ncbi:MAG: HNH endonuclease [Gallionella sp.]